MDDPFLMRGFERVGDLACNQKNVGDGHASLFVSKRDAFHQFEHEGPHAIRVLHAVDGGDVGMVERRQQACLALEARQAVRISRERGRDNLDRHVAAERGIARAIDLAHAARPKEADDLVRPQTRPRS